MTRSGTGLQIGLPVFNGESYLRQTLDSLLAQDYRDFQLIISDNASTDATPVICREYEERDIRIRYHRSEVNRGAVWNFNRVFTLSTGEYFMWASHDDWWAPQYLRACLAAYETSVNIVLAGAVCNSVNPADGQLIYRDEGFSTVGLRPRERFIRYKSTVHGGRHIGGIFYGIYRRRALSKVMPLRNVLAGDHLVLAELCFQGEFVTVPQPLMVKRWGGASVSLKETARVLRINNFVLVKFPYLVREIYLQKIIFRANCLSLVEKMRLSVWSWGHYVRVCLLRSLGLGLLRFMVTVFQALPSQLHRPIRRLLGLGDRPEPSATRQPGADHE